MNTLRLLVERELDRQHLSVREAAGIFGVSHTTIHRILKNETIDLDTVIKICNVLGVPPAIALNAEAKDEETQVVNTIAAIIEKEPRLAELFTDLARDLRDGNVSPDDVLDIVSYATYRLRNKNANQRRNDQIHAEDR